MDTLTQELFIGIGDRAHLMRILVRLVVAAILGGIVGFEREHEGKRAGIRTHMLVSLGAALFALVPLEAGMASADASRVMQGIVAGIGFLGAGTILKLSDVHEVKGLTSAACIWLTAAVGMAVGVGMIWPAVVGSAVAWVILDSLHRVEKWLKNKNHCDPAAPPNSPPSEAK